jgi:hypothetical protein
MRTDCSRGRRGGMSPSEYFPPLVTQVVHQRGDAANGRLAPEGRGRNEREKALADPRLTQLLDLGYEIPWDAIFR